MVEMNSDIFCIGSPDEMIPADGQPRLILVCENPSSEKIVEIARWGQVCGIAQSFQEDSIEVLIDQRIEEAQRASELNLETKGEVDTKKTERAQKRVANLSRQTDALHQALVAIHMANSVGEVESLLNEALVEAMQLSWVRLFFQWHDHMQDQFSRLVRVKLIQAPLVIGARNLGLIVYAREQQNFTKTESDFLHQIADGVAMAIDRLQKLDQAEDLKREWGSTFDSISEPLCLTNENFLIQKANKAFTDITGRSMKDLVGVNCFAAFSDQNTSMRVLDSEDFKVERASKAGGEPDIYSVTTQKIQVEESEPFILLVLFRNITEQQKLEKKMFESAKMAELGTVGSSIAHELNNPLGGILSFIQLIKMDCKESDPVRPDIEEMEKAAIRCKEIVENLLGYTRQPDSDLATSYNLLEVIAQARRIVELKTKSFGIQTKMNSPSEEILLPGHPGLMSQAFSHILHLSIDAISKARAKDDRFVGEIRIDIKPLDKKIFVEISDNGLHSEKPELKLACQILEDYNGTLEISSQSKEWTVTKVALSNV